MKYLLLSLALSASVFGQTIKSPGVNGENIVNPAFRNAVLPSQSTHSGKFLTTDGAGAVTWATVTSNLTSGPVTSSGGVSAIADGAIGVAKITGLGTAATANTTITGAANGVLQVTSSGDVNLMGAAPVSTALAIGGVFMPDSERLWFLNNTNKADGASLYFSTDHDVTGGEFYIASPNRIAILPGTYGAIQIGIASGAANVNKQFAYLQQRGGATVDAQLANSLPLYFQPAFWDTSLTPDANASSLAGSIQAIAADTAGNTTLDFSVRATQPNGGGADGSRPLDMQISPAGVWEAGKAPTWDMLADDAAVTQTCSIYKTIQTAKVTINADRTLVISGAVAGMRGVIYVTQGTSGSRLLTLPTASAKPSGWALSTTEAAIDRLAWEYDGSYFYWSIVNGISVAFDTDSDAFFTRASITSPSVKSAVNNLVVSLKSASLWTKFSVLYPFAGDAGDGVANSKNLKADAYNITWSGGPTHNANGVTGDDTDAYGNTGFNMAVLAQNSAFMYAYCRTTTPTTTGKFLMGGHQGTTSRSAMLANTVSGNLEYSLNTTADASVTAGNDFSNHFAVNRSASGTDGIQTYVGSTRSLATSTSVAPWTSSMYLLARNNNGTAAAFSSANLAFVAFGSSLTEAEWTAFRAIIDTFQTALGRANP